MCKPAACPPNPEKCDNNNDILPLFESDAEQEEEVEEEEEFVGFSGEDLSAIDRATVAEHERDQMAHERDQMAEQLRVANKRIAQLEVEEQNQQQQQKGQRLDANSGFAGTSSSSTVAEISVLVTTTTAPTASSSIASVAGHASATTAANQMLQPLSSLPVLTPQLSSTQPMVSSLNDEPMPLEIDGPFGHADGAQAASPLSVETTAILEDFDRLSGNVSSNNESSDDLIKPSLYDEPQKIPPGEVEQNCMTCGNKIDECRCFVPDV